MANRVIHFELQADDISRAKAFYEKAFGWEIEKFNDPGQSAGMDYWMISTGPKDEPGINGGMYQRPKDKKLYTFDCTIMVEDLDKAITDVKRHGGKIIGEKMKIPKVGWFSGGLDPEGNKFGLMQPHSRQPM